MDDDEERNWLIDNNPAKLLPFEKRLIPEDPDAIDAGRHFIRDGITNAADVRL